MAVQPTDDLTWLTDEGVISELNRRYLHPRGLALLGDSASGRLTFQATSDPFGWIYNPLLSDRLIDQEDAFDDLLLADREGALGWVVQPLPDGP